MRFCGFDMSARFAVMLALVLALAGLGHAHKGHVDPGLAAYVSAGGELSDICGEVPETAVSVDCEACRLSGDAGLYGVKIDASDLRLLAQAGWVATHPRVNSCRVIVVYGPRAPPLV